MKHAGGPRGALLLAPGTEEQIAAQPSEKNTIIIIISIIISIIIIVTIIFNFIISPC